jgi:peptide/nickel transport system permease protein
MAIDTDIIEPLQPLAAAPVAASGESLSTRQLAWRRFRRHRLALASAVLLLLIGVASVVVPLLSKDSYHQTFTAGRIVAPFAHSGPSWKHWFGVDEIGRDVFTRVLYGGRISLMVGVSVALSAGVIGSIVGALAGYYGGWIDNLLMRVTDLFLALPFLVILIVGSRVPFIADRGALGIVVILSLFFWMPLARIVRGVFLSMKEKEFVEAARSVGASNPRIIFGQMLPNALGPIIVNATLGIAGAILAESALSFLGFGVQPPLPTWGNLLLEAQPFALTSPYLTLFPGLFILATVLCVNFLGDGLRDALDPHQRIRARE